jgi:putative PIN family toxin of toxin-antitoxin system
MASKTIIRIALDTNIWISFSIGKKLDKLKEIFLNDKIVIFICPEIIEEYLRITVSKKIAKYLSQQRILDTLDLMETFTKSKDVLSRKQIARDPNDDFLLSFAKENKLDFLITGDKDLLVIKNYHSTRILTFKEFSEMM